MLEETKTKLKSIKETAKLGIKFVTIINKLFAELEENSEISSGHQEWLKSFLQKKRNRVLVAYFLSVGKISNTGEKVGLGLFVGLINAVDDLIDRQNTSKSQASLSLDKKNLMEQEITIGDQAVQIKVLIEVIKSYFPNKKTLIDSFLEKAIANEKEFPNRKPGNYTIQNAIVYRQGSSQPYNETCLRLVGIDNESEIEEKQRFAKIQQWIDDIVDLFSDFHTQAINPIIGAAYDNREGEKLEQTYNKIIEKKGNETDNWSSLKKILASQKMLRSIPKTREQILNKIENMAQTKIERGLIWILKFF